MSTNSRITAKLSVLSSADMTLILAASIAVNLHSEFIDMENQLLAAGDMDYETSFLYEWQTAEEDLDFLDYTYCFEVARPNKRYLQPLTLSASSSCSKHSEILLSDTGGIQQTQQREALLNISMEKLRSMDDPEKCLRRTVLINNTLKCLRATTRNEDSTFNDSDYHATPCKRLRHNDSTNSTSTDTFKELNHQAEFQEAFHTKSSEGDKEIDSKQIDKLLVSHDMALCASEMSPMARNNTEKTKRNCDRPIRFTELEFPNVLCALET